MSTRTSPFPCQNSARNIVLRRYYRRALRIGDRSGLPGSIATSSWKVLTYETDQGGYVVDLDKKLLEDAPRYADDAEPDYSPDYGRSVYGYYGVMYPY